MSYSEKWEDAKEIRRGKRIPLGIAYRARIEAETKKHDEQLAKEAELQLARENAAYKPKRTKASKSRVKNGPVTVRHASPRESEPAGVS